MSRSRMVVAVSPFLFATTVNVGLFAQQHDADRSPQHRSSDTQETRPSRHGPGSDHRGDPHAAATFPLEFRSIDGWGNNLARPELGSAHQPFLRLLGDAYTDGVAAPAGQERPSARAVSNAIAAQAHDVPNAVRATDTLWQWGQFLDHDIVETPIASPGEPFDISVPVGDPWFDPGGSGTAAIPLDRSAWVLEHGARQQLNAITAFIDASNVYGSDPERAAALRTLDGTGRLATSPGDLLPYNHAGLANAPAPTADYFLAGDIRANEQVALTALHTLFVREHNTWAEVLGEHFPGDGDTIYQWARALVAAEMQAITYREFLPVLLGEDALAPYRGYRPQVDPGIANLFATAAFRMGHTLLSPQLLRLDATGAHPEGPLSLSAAFFSPETFLATGPDPLLRGLAGQVCQELDPLVIDAVRNFLFGPPGAGGFDLAALNVQRGRDHGLPGYARLRAQLGLGAAHDFGDVTDDRMRARALAHTYGSLGQVDAWVGMLCEDHVPGALVGPTLRHVLADQFERLRDGDRFWYESYLPRVLVRFVHTQSLATIIRRNTDIGDELPDDVFVASSR